MRGAERLYRLLRGEAEVQAAPRDRESFLNLCAERGLNLWEPEAGEGTVTLRLSPSELSRLIELQEETGKFSILSVRKRGAGFAGALLRRRWGLLAGALLAVLLAAVSSFFIWQIEIVGVTGEESARIMSALEDCGIHVGSFAAGLSVPEVQNELLLRLPELAWITVNVRGSRAYVLSRPRLTSPELFKGGEASAIYARRGGVITETVVLHGVAEVGTGDTVAAGDLLVSGAPAAQGAVIARTWYELAAAMPLCCAAKSYTGREEVRFRLIFPEKKVDLHFYGGNTYESCDKIREERLLTLPDGTLLPLGVEITTLREYRQIPAELPREAAEGLLRSELLERLGEECRGSVTEAGFYSSLSDGILTVTLRAECLEDIADRR